MKKILVLLAAGAAMSLFSGCASVHPMGAWYTDVKVPVTATSNAGAKKGVSKCKSIFNLVAMGDASIDAAKKQGGITKVSAVDWKAKSILGIISDYECTVYGD